MEYTKIELKMIYDSLGAWFAKEEDYLRKGRVFDLLNKTHDLLYNSESEDK